MNGNKREDQYWFCHGVVTDSDIQIFLKNWEEKKEEMMKNGNDKEIE